MENLSQQVFASEIRNSTISSKTFANYGSKGIYLILDLTDAPGKDTITLKIEGYDQVSGKYYDILVGPALSDIGTFIMRIYPTQITGIETPSDIIANPSSKNLTIAGVLPSMWRATMTHSAATNFTYSVGASLLG